MIILLPSLEHPFCTTNRMCLPLLRPQLVFRSMQNIHCRPRLDFWHKQNKQSRYPTSHLFWTTWILCTMVNFAVIFYFALHEFRPQWWILQSLYVFSAKPWACVLLDKQDEPAPSWTTAGLLAQAGHSPKPQIRLQTPTKQTAEVAHLSRFLVLREYHPHTMAV